MRGKIAITIVIALAMFAPAATARWSGFGSYEPDTPQDIADGYMFLDPSTDTEVDRVYFNAFPNFDVSGTNLNSGVAGSRIATLGSLNWQAMLGMWRDCNGDGYVGAADSALLYYRTETFDVNAVCPIDSLYRSADGAWVYELVYVGPTDDGFTDPEFIFNDTAARVWGDIGLPGPGTGASCALTPLPSGTTSNTGAAIAYADCGVGVITTTVNALDEVFGLGLGFEDPDRPQDSESPLNQNLPVSTFGNPYGDDGWQTGLLQGGGDGDAAETREDSTFYVWDCTSDPLVVVENPAGAQSIPVDDPTGGEVSSFLFDDGNPTLLYVNTSDEYTLLYTPAPELTGEPTDSSLLNAANNSLEGTGDCDYSTGGSIGVGLEGAHDSSAQAAGKKEAEMNFFFYEGTHDGNLITGDMADLAGELLGETIPNPLTGTPDSVGLGFGPGQFLFNPVWYADALYVTTGQTINADTLAPSDKDYWTFYATVGEATFAVGDVVAQAAGTYGAEACGSFDPGAGISAGWDCDRTHWYISSGGSEDTDPDRTKARAGDSYWLRDTECFDGTLVEGVPAYASGQAIVGPDCGTAP